MGNLGKWCIPTSEEEQKYITDNKAEIDTIFNSLFESQENFNIKDERYKNFRKLMKVFEYQKYFLNKLHPSRNNTISNETFNSLKEIFSYILLNIKNTSINEEFILIFESLYILSDSFYYINNEIKIFLKDEKKGKKIFKNKKI